MVRLKASSDSKASTEVHDFNSTMVRLKDAEVTAQKDMLSNFNSTMVRLKEYVRNANVPDNAISIPLWYD